jgi:hypothetical protein
LEYVDAQIKLGLIQYKQQCLAQLGNNALSGNANMVASGVEVLERIDSLIRSEPTRRRLAEMVVKCLEVK